MLKNRLRQARKAWRLARIPLFRRGLLRGIGAAIEHRDLLAAFDFRTVVDIGANVGQFALLVRELFPAAIIYSFEPLQQPSKKFLAFFANDARVTLFRVAVAQNSARRRMHLSAKNDSSSLLPITQGQIEFAPGTESVGYEEVSTGPLEQFLRTEQIVSPALLKLDVQGFELEALKGCESLLGHFKYVYAEASFIELYEGQVLAHQLVQWLSARDFHILGAANPFYNNRGGMVQLDILFEQLRARD